MGCLIYIFLIPIYCFVIIFSLGFSLIYFLISLIIEFINKIKSLFTKNDYVYTKPTFGFKKVIITNNKSFNKKDKKDKKGKIIDAEIEE